MKQETMKENITSPKNSDEESESEREAEGKITRSKEKKAAPHFRAVVGKSSSSRIVLHHPL